jgi:hypothetical protein
MCINIKLIPFDCQKVEEGIKKSKIGIYNSFLFIAQKAIEKKSDELFLNYSSVAMKYQLENNKYINYDGKPQKLLYELMSNYINDFYAFLEHRKFYKASQILINIKSICDTLREAHCYDIYKSLNNKMQIAIHGKDNKKIVDSPSVYLNTKIFNHEDSIEKYCFAIQQNIEKLYQKGNFYVIESNYLNAFAAYNEALKIWNNKCSKSLDNITQVKNKLNEISKPVYYLNNIENIKLLINEKKYDTAFFKYLYFEEYFNINNIQKYGINHNPLVLFVMYQKDNNFILSSVDNFIKIKHYLDAMSVLDRLRQYKFNAKLTKTQQVFLGQIFAKIDFKQNNKINPKQQIKLYTIYEDWYNDFVQSYIKTWKHLKRNR